MMQVLRNKSKQCLQLLKAHPPLFDFPSHHRCSNYSYYNCIKLLQTTTHLHAPNSQPPPPVPPTPNPPTIDSAEEDAEAIYNSIHQFILAEGGGDEAIVPAGWVLSMAQRCSTYYDIKLLIFLLHKHRLLMKNPDPHLTQEITRACLRCGALLYEFNNFPGNPDVAEIVFRIHRNMYSCDQLLWKARLYLNFGLQFNQASLEMLMESAVNNGDVVSLRIFESAISKIMNRHTFRSGFAYAKGLLLDGEPEVAANVIIELLRQFMVREAHLAYVNPNTFFKFVPCNLLAYYRKKQLPWPEELMIEIQNLVKEWPAQIIKLRTSTKIKKERIATLKSCIPKMVEYLSTKGFELNLDLGHLNDLGH